jgi:DNA-binding response OmpR family regulator
MPNILVADDDRQTREKIKAYAVRNGFVVDEAINGIQAAKMFYRKEYDIVIMDTVLPELDGLNVAKLIRKSAGVPIIFVTAKSREHERLAGFDAGADDYVIKPFYVTELFARIHVIVNRSTMPMTRAVLSTGDVSVDRISRTVYVDGGRVPLAPREYDLLVFLMENSNTALSRDVLLREVWGEDFVGTDRTVDTHIRALRGKMGAYGDCIATVWGVGYKLEK